MGQFQPGGFHGYTVHNGTAAANGPALFDRDWDDCFNCSDLAVILPLHSKTAVDKAGKRIAESSESSEDHAIINNWRAAHAYPLAAIHSLFRIIAPYWEKDTYFTSQRLKRLTSIIAKLRRQPEMRLSRMQDIGGCRIVVPHGRALVALRNMIGGDSYHDRVRESDYLFEPKVSGYSGIHLIWGFKSKTHQALNGLQVEMQLRTYPMHDWAAAVEVTGTMLGQDLKSGEGNPDWLDFFAKVGAAIAEGERTIWETGQPWTMDAVERHRAAIKPVASKLNAIKRLGDWHMTTQTAQLLQSHFDYFLLEHQIEAGETRVKGFTAKEFDRATADYSESEETAAERGVNVVLVSVSEVSILAKAYPSYFNDTQAFVEFLKMLAG